MQNLCIWWIYLYLSHLWERLSYSEPKMVQTILLVNLYLFCLCIVIGRLSEHPHDLIVLYLFSFRNIRYSNTLFISLCERLFLSFGICASHVCSCHNSFSMGWSPFSLYSFRPHFTSMCVSIMWASVFWVTNCVFICLYESKWHFLHILVLHHLIFLLVERCCSFGLLNFHCLLYSIHWVIHLQCQTCHHLLLGYCPVQLIVYVRWSCSIILLCHWFPCFQSAYPICPLLWLPLFLFALLWLAMTFDSCTLFCRCIPVCCWHVCVALFLAIFCLAIVICESSTICIHPDCLDSAASWCTVSRTSFIIGNYFHEFLRILYPVCSLMK